MRYAVKRKSDGKYFRSGRRRNGREFVDDIEKATLYRTPSSILLSLGKKHVLVNGEWVAYDFKNPDHRPLGKLVSALTSLERKRVKTILSNEYEIIPVRIENSY